MNSQSIRRRRIREAEGDAGPQTRKCLLQKSRRGGTGVLHRPRKRGMLECPLRLTVVVETELIHRCVAEGPGVADVPLLESFIGNRPESRHIRAGRLKL